MIVALIISRLPNESENIIAHFDKTVRILPSNNSQFLICVGLVCNLHHVENLQNSWIKGGDPDIIHGPAPNELILHEKSIYHHAI